MGACESARSDTKMHKIAAAEIKVAAPLKKVPTGARIAILGAGPAGLHMAHMLKRHGFNNFSIFEKTGRIGGKTLTVRHTGGLQDIIHEVGTVYLSPAYESVRQLAMEVKEMGASVDVAEEITAHHIEKYRVFTNDPTLEKLKNAHGFMGFEEFVFASVEHEVLDPKWWFLPDKLQIVTFGVHIKRYCDIHREIFGDNYDAIPPRLSKEKMARLNMSFLEFLHHEHCEGLIPLAAYGYSAQGYGVISEVPAFYGLSWFTPKFMMGYLLQKLPGHHPGKSMFKHGYETLYKELVKVNRLNEVIRLNSKITKITREDKDGGVTITGTVNGQAFTEQFDYLIVGCPLSELHTFLDLDAEEKALFDPIVSFTLRATVLDRPPEPDRKEHVDVFVDSLLGGDKKTKPGLGDVYALRDSVVVCKGHHPDVAHQRREQVCYQFVAASSDTPEHSAEIKKLMDEKLDQFIEGHIKSKDVKIVVDNINPYFYHYPKDAIQNGILWDLLDRQGHRRTIFNHATCLFESIVDVTNYNNMLFKKFFLPLS